jgi:hypothetical protein
MNCARCDHTRAEHCTAGTQHTDHKEDARMVPIEWRHGTTKCVTNHCNQPLCSCVDFIEGETNALTK